MMASDSLSPLAQSLCLGLAAHQPLKCYHAQSQLGPLMTWERLMFSNLTPSELRFFPAALVSSSGMLMATTPPLHCVSISRPATSPHVVALQSLLQCLSQPCAIEILFQSCLITKILSLKLCVRLYLFLLRVCPCFSDRNRLQWLQFGRYHHSNSTITFTLASFLCSIRLECRTILILLRLLGAAALVCSSHPSFGTPSHFFSRLVKKGLRITHTYTWTSRPGFSIHVVASAPDNPCICW